MPRRSSGKRSKAAQQLEKQIADQKSQLHAMMSRGVPTPILEDALAAMYRTLQKLKTRVVHQ
jgi:hypothetical protein